MEKEENKVTGARREIEIEDGNSSDNSINDRQTDRQNVDQENDQREDELSQALKKIADLEDKLMRTAADYDNYRKTAQKEFDNYRQRTLKEKANLIINGSEKAVMAILPVLDDMERAINNADKTADIHKLENGWELIYRKLVKILESMGVKQIDAKGQDFNVDYHEAVTMVPGVDDDKKGKVIDCMQTGYSMNDKIIRHAKVAVGQ